MGRITDHIKNYIQLHTSDMENAEYVDIMREIGEWAKSQADLIEYRDEIDIEEEDNDTVYPII